MNTITLLGRTTAQIELKQTKTGKSAVSFTLAVKRPFTKDITDFFTIVAWDKQAELLARYVGKGSLVCVRGHLTTRSWEDSNGTKRYATEVVTDEVSFCESKKDGTDTNVPTSQNTAPAYIPDAYLQPNFESIENEEGLPF